MAKNINHLLNKRSNQTNNGIPIAPTSSQIEHGELAINYAKGKETIFIKNDSDEIVPFSCDYLLEYNIGDISQYWKNVEDSGLTVDNVVDALNYNMWYVVNNFQRKPVVLYETDGSTGLIGINDNTMSLNTWQLENLDFTPYKFAIAYFKQADRDFSTTQANYITPSLMVFIPLDEASKSKGYDAYLGGANTTNPNDRNVHFCVLAAIDGTKTKFKVVSEHSIYGTALGGRNDNGRYCYKIEGYF